MSKEERFEQNQKLVYFVINTHFAAIKDQREDLIQVGMMGLWKACLKYEDNKSRFSTFAIRCIKNEVLMYIRGLRRMNDRAVCQFSQLEEHEKEMLMWQPAFEIEESDIYLSLLTPKERDLFVRIARGQSEEKIAKVYGMTKAGVSARFQKLKRKILKLKKGKLCH